jgi:hypothetical protein
MERMSAGLTSLMKDMSSFASQRLISMVAVLQPSHDQPRGYERNLVGPRVSFTGYLHVPNLQLKLGSSKSHELVAEDV